jgi:hypothetical protein
LRFSAPLGDGGQRSKTTSVEPCIELRELLLGRDPDLELCRQGEPDRGGRGYEDLAAALGLV